MGHGLGQFQLTGPLPQGVILAARFGHVPKEPYEPPMDAAGVQGGEEAFDDPTVFERQHVPGLMHGPVEMVHLRDEMIGIDELVFDESEHPGVIA